MFQEKLTYEVDGKLLEGFLAFNDSTSEPRPAVIIFHAWRGHDQFVQDKAKEIADLGYIAFAADVYGKGVQATNDEESMRLMLPLFKNRKLLQERAQGAVNLLLSRKEVDNSRLAAIGFCFGGLTAIELQRSGAPLKGIVSFHGVLANQLGDVKAERPPSSSKLHGSALFLHGHDDPLVSDTDIKNTTNDLDEAEVDWQFHIFSHTQHAFTNPLADSPDQGILYNKKSCQRAWQSMQNFLNEVFTL